MNTFFYESIDDKGNVVRLEIYSLEQAVQCGLTLLKNFKIISTDEVGNETILMIVTA